MLVHGALPWLLTVHSLPSQLSFTVGATLMLASGQSSLQFWQDLGKPSSQYAPCFICSALFVPFRDLLRGPTCRSPRLAVCRALLVSRALDRNGRPATELAVASPSLSRTVQPSEAQSFGASAMQTDEQASEKLHSWLRLSGGVYTARPGNYPLALRGPMKAPPSTAPLLRPSLLSEVKSSSSIPRSSKACGDKRVQSLPLLTASAGPTLGLQQPEEKGERFKIKHFFLCREWRENHLVCARHVRQSSNQPELQRQGQGRQALAALSYCQSGKMLGLASVLLLEGSAQRPAQKARGHAVTEPLTGGLREWVRPPGQLPLHPHQKQAAPPFPTPG